LKTVDAAFRNAVRKNLRAGVKSAGDPIVAAIKANASSQGLEKAAAATGISIRYSTNGASIRIQVDHNRAPYARPLEVGNKTQFSEAAINAHGGFKVVNGRRVANRRSAYKEIRKSGVGFGRVNVHPVWDYPLSYASRVTAQPLRPFFFKAITANADNIDLTMERVVVQTARDAGFNLTS
jgi:hypothetical protein